MRARILGHSPTRACMRIPWGQFRKKILDGAIKALLYISEIDCHEGIKLSFSPLVHLFDWNPRTHEWRGAKWHDIRCGVCWTESDDVALWCSTVTEIAGIEKDTWHRNVKRHAWETIATCSGVAWHNLELGVQRRFERNYHHSFWRSMAKRCAACVMEWGRKQPHRFVLRQSTQLPKCR